jgi:hypothetical protein
MHAMSACNIPGCDPCINPSFCEACQKADREVGQQRPPPRIPPDWDKTSLDALWARLNQARATPQSTVEAVMVCVRESGLKALEESANLERLSRCDESARAQINNQIARIAEQNQCQR